MDDIKQVGKYLDETRKTSTRALNRERPPQFSHERIRDIFDPDNSMRGVITTPDAAKRIKLDINFGRKLPALGCCADCMCGITESYTSESLISGNLYVTTPYVAGSTVVFIDGFQATAGVDYAEINPETGQIAIYGDADSIVVSYIYTVGNCTDACAESPFVCMDYGFVTNLVTVFTDTFQRTGNGTPYPAGGCGVYRNFTGTADFEPSISGGVLLSNSFRANIGGPNNVNGASYEIIMGVEPSLSGGMTISAGNSSYAMPGFGISVSGAGVLTISLNGGSGNSTSGTPGFAWEAGTRYWVRMSQNIAGYGLRFWPQDGDEANAFALALGPGLYQPTLHFVAISKNSLFILESIQVGAGLDVGDWGDGAPGGSLGTGGYYCSPPPNDGLTRPVAFCSPEFTSVTTGNVAYPSCGSFNSFPIFIPDPAGLGVMIDYSESVAAVSLEQGHPSGIRYRGQLTASLSSGPGPYGTVAVQIKTYAYPPTLMTRNGFQGGGIVAGFSLPVNQQPVDVDFVIPGGPGAFTYWGMSIVGLDGYIQSLPGLSFLNHLGVSFSNMTSEALPSTQCSAQCECLEVE